MIPNIFKSLVILLILISTGCSLKPNSLESRIHDGHFCWHNTEWQKISKINIAIDSPTYNWHGTYEISIFENMDMIFKIQSEQDSKKDNYELWVVEGRTLLSKELKLKPGYEIDYLDSPALMYQIAIAILSIAADKDPLQFKGTKTYNISHDSIPIKTTTPSASGLYEAPWTASVELSKEENTQINFKTNFMFSEKSKHDSVMNFEGTIFQYGKIAPSAILDSVDISSWHQYTIGPFTRKYNGNTIYDYGASPYKEKLKTIGELRASHKEKR